MISRPIKKAVIPKGGTVAPSVVKRIRDSHHMIARLLASGLPQNEVAARCGFNCGYISQLYRDPAMQELVAYYRDKVTDRFVENLDPFFEMSDSNMRKAERIISDRLDDEEDALSIRELLAITSDRADRFGYPKRAVQTNVNIDFAAKLEAAIKRSRKQLEE